MSKTFPTLTLFCYFCFGFISWCNSNLDPRMSVFQWTYHSWINRIPQGQSIGLAPAVHWYKILWGFSPHLASGCYVCVCIEVITTSPPFSKSHLEHFLMMALRLNSNFLTLRPTCRPTVFMTDVRAGGAHSSRVQNTNKQSAQPSV